MRLRRIFEIIDIKYENKISKHSSSTSWKAHRTANRMEYGWIHGSSTAPAGRFIPGEDARVIWLPPLRVFGRTRQYFREMSPERKRLADIKGISNGFAMPVFSP